MPEFKVGDVVVLLADVPNEGLRKGQIGAVVHEFDDPTVAYETEFTDADGRTVAQLALLPNQIRIWKGEQSDANAALTMVTAKA